MIKKTQEELVKIYDRNLEILQIEGYRDQNGDWHSLIDAAEGSRLYPKLSKLSKVPKFDETKIYVQNIDIIQKAVEMGSGTAILNMASDRKPGGGVANGSRAEEEELCRRTTLLRSLYAFSPIHVGLVDGTLNRKGYPLPTFGGIYTPVVQVIRSANSYNLLSNIKLTSVITVSAVRHPEIDKRTNLMVEKDAEIMKGKIRAIFRMAILNNRTKLCLSAFGCGAFCCPPLHVAKLFKAVLEEPEFNHSFREICFAIIEDQNSKGINFKSFKEVFDGI